MNVNQKQTNQKSGANPLWLSPLHFRPHRPRKRKKYLVLSMLIYLCGWVVVGSTVYLRDTDFPAPDMAPLRIALTAGVALDQGKTYDPNTTGSNPKTLLNPSLPAEYFQEPNTSFNSPLSASDVSDPTVHPETADFSTDQALEYEMKRMRDALLRQDLLNSQTLLIIKILVFLVFFGVSSFLAMVLIQGIQFMKTKQNQYENTMLNYLAESHDLILENARHNQKQPFVAAMDDDTRALDNPTDRAIASTDNTAKASAQIQRPKSPIILAPHDLIQYLIEQCQAFNCFRYPPVMPRTEWGLGLTTETGHVRKENQDYGLIFHIAHHDILVIADGCGGVAKGQQAAYLSVLYSALSVIRTFGQAPPWRGPDPRYAAAKAIQAAEYRLGSEAIKNNIPLEDRRHLRTTLIVIIGSKKEIGYAYIGDGGACIIRSNGQIEHFLKPQKADEARHNVLAASLGPSIEGEPVVDRIRRSAGDLVIAGTDGIFDRIDESFPKSVLRVAIQRQGDLQLTTEQIVRECAELQDPEGYLCDDNLTLGLMGDGTAPTMPRGFWKADDDNEGKTAGDNSPCSNQPFTEVKGKDKSNHARPRTNTQNQVRPKARY